MSVYREPAEQSDPDVEPRESWWSTHRSFVRRVFGTIAATAGIVLCAFAMGRCALSNQDGNAAIKACGSRGLEPLKVDRIAYGHRRVTCRVDAGIEEVIVPP